MSMDLTVPPQPRRTRRRWILLACLPVAAVLLLAGLVALVGLRSFSVPSASMTPAVPAGSHVLVDKIAFRVTGLHRGDIVIARTSPGSPAMTTIKRLIGLPGDRISCLDGAVQLNGTPLPEPYLAPGTRTDACQPVTLGPDELWLLGDHRSASFDSRYDGPAHRDQVIGRMLLRLS